MPRSRELGRLVESFSILLDSSSSWEDFVHRARNRSCLSKDIRDIQHPAVPLLEIFRRNGAPASFIDPWTLDRKDAAVAVNGYASTRRFQGFLEQEMADMITQGFWVALPYEKVRHLPELRLSQAGIIPQKDRRPRTIVDYRRSGVNDATIDQAPTESMQFGRALERGLHQILTAPEEHGPVYMLKNDLADGFYRIFLEPAGLLALAMVLPVPPGAPPMVAIPLTLPMGWKESPPNFCALTETIVDVATAKMTDDWQPAPHPMEALAISPPPDPDDSRVVHQHTTLSEETPVPTTTEVRHLDVFVDDMLMFAQGSHATLDLLRRQLFHVTNSFLPQTTPRIPIAASPSPRASWRRAMDAGPHTRRFSDGWSIQSRRPLSCRQLGGSASCKS